jgi:hypothetical protein
VADVRAAAAVVAAWTSALAIAVATSSVNPASRASVPAGSGCWCEDAAITKPHSRSSTLIGTPTIERMPCLRATSADSPEAAS